MATASIGASLQTRKEMHFEKVEIVNPTLPGSFWSVPEMIGRTWSQSIYEPFCNTDSTRNSQP